MFIRLFFAGTILLITLFGCAKQEGRDEQNFKQSFQQSFIASCVEGSTKGPNALGQQLATDKCACMANYLISTYSSTELTMLSQSVSPDAAKIMDAAITACK